MTSDLLSSASEALRRSAGPADADSGTGDAGETLARVLHTVRRRQRAQRRLRVVLVPVVALVMASGAWALGSGRLAVLLKGERRSPPAGQGTPRASARSPSVVAPTVVPLPVAEPPAVDPPAVTPAAASGSGRAHGERPDDLYRRAHQAHFGRGDFAAALPLWDRYLAVTPLPRLAVEARFNRAIALVRLGRLPSAAAGLRPFAAGDYGSYRRAEAQRLLDAIESGTVP